MQVSKINVQRTNNVMQQNNKKANSQPNFGMALKNEEMAKLIGQMTPTKESFFDKLIVFWHVLTTKKNPNTKAQIKDIQATSLSLRFDDDETIESVIVSEFTNSDALAIIPKGPLKVTIDKLHGAVKKFSQIVLHASDDNRTRVYKLKTRLSEIETGISLKLQKLDDSFNTSKRVHEDRLAEIGKNKEERTKLKQDFSNQKLAYKREKQKLNEQLARTQVQLERANNRWSQCEHAYAEKVTAIEACHADQKAALKV